MDATMIPAGWATGRPPAERLARFLLARGFPDLRFDLVREDLVRAAVAERVAGHMLPDELAARDRLLAEETERCRVVLDFVVGVTALALAELGVSG